MNYLEVANSTLLWIVSVPVAVIVGLQAFVFYKRAVKSASIVDLSASDAKKAFRVGAFSAIGPALGVFVVMLGLMAVIGGPLAWMRLAVIGAAPTELAAANMAAKAMDIELGAQSYGVEHFANAAWVMALNGSAWLLTTGLFSHKLDSITEKVSGGDAAKLGILSVTAMCGAFSYLFGNQIVKGLEPEHRAVLVSGIAAAICMLLMEKLAKKYPKLTEYNLGIAMVAGMVAAVVYNSLGGK